MASLGSFQCKVDHSEGEPHTNKVTTVKCQGRLVSANVEELKELVKPLIILGGRIVVDLGDLNFVDSAGLGALVGLKASAIKQGLCNMELVNLTPRVQELVRITGLTRLFSS